MFNQQESIKKLAELDVRPCAEALVYYAGVGDLAIVELLLAAAINPNVHDKYGNTALITAARYNQKAMVEFLLQHGADVNVHAKNGWSPLQVAVYESRTEIINLLKQAGAKE